jgi:hypothetical protein
MKLLANVIGHTHKGNVGDGECHQSRSIVKRARQSRECTTPPSIEKPSFGFVFLTN